MIGRVIGNTYRIVEKIGQGGMGAVYRAVDEVLEREVAIKAVRPDLAREKEIVDRFRQEARTLARVSHPAIATIYNFLQEGEELFLVMELVRGRTLADVLRTEGALPWQRAVSLLASALDGIERAHRMGIIHRDLKPENLMLTEDGTLKVMDFGIARAVGSGHLTRTGLLVGTLRYIAPEQIRGEEVDRRTDIYSLGIVLYEMLAGRVPFEGGNDYAILRAQIEDPPTPPVFHVPDLPPWLDRAVLKALAKDRDERYQTVEELRAVLASRGTVQSTEDYLDATLPLREDQTRITFRTPPPTPASSPATTAGPPPPPRTPPPRPTPQTTAASIPAAGPLPPAAPSPPISAGSYGAVGLNRSGSGTWKLALGAALVVVLAIAGALLWLGKQDGEAQKAAEAAPAPAANPDSNAALPAAPGDSAQPAEPQDPAPLDTQSPTASRQPSPSPARETPRTLPPAPEPIAPAADEPPAADSNPEPPATGENTGTFQPPERQEELPADELKRIGGELQAGTAQLFASFQAHLEKKEEAGQEITDDDEQLEEDLEALMGSAERFNEGLQGGGVLARLRRRSAGDMEPIRRRVQRLTERAQRVDALVARLDTGPEVKGQWQEVRSRWRRAVQILE